jgi:Na+-transporting NADH:ubiquinone oxidoreductase subunit NqrE
VSAVKGANLALRFLLELCALAAVAYWGSRVSSTAAVNVIVAIAAPLALATVWGIWLAPNASRRLDPPGRTLLELAVLASAVAALVAVDESLLAALLAAVAVINGLLLHMWGLDSAETHA